MTAANEILGGVPTLQYLDIPNIGRGEIVRLFLAGADVEFIDERIEMTTAWPKVKALMKADNNAAARVPVLTLKSGVVLTQSVPTLRYLAAKLGHYGGKTTEEVYLLDRVSDLYIDWRVQHLMQAYPDATKDHNANCTPRFLELFESIYKDSTGLLLGSEHTYADVCVYQFLHDDNVLEKLESFPSLARFVVAFEKVPTIHSYLQLRKKHVK